MIPSNEFTSAPYVGDFLYPNTEPYQPLSQNVWGGIGLNDPSKGRLYKIWNISYDGTNINVKPIDGPIAYNLTESDVQSVSLAFDNNMALVIAWTTSLGANLYYFDTIIMSYTTRYFSDVTSCRICVDMAEEYYISDSDVIFAYTRNGNLYWRQQRDRYDIERFIGSTNKKLVKMGLSTENRLQFKLI